MRLVIIISFILLLASCGIRKETQQLQVIKDSTIIRNEVIVDTFRVKQDVFSDSINLDLLKQLGQATFRGDRTTTRIFYRNGNIGFQTHSDSLLNLILNRIESKEIVRDNTNVITTTTTKKTNWWIPYTLGLATLLFILILIYYVKKRFFN